MSYGLPLQGTHQGEAQLHHEDQVSRGKQKGCIDIENPVICLLLDDGRDGLLKPGRCIVGGARHFCLLVAELAS